METGFKDRTAIKNKEKKTNAWNYDQPPYDKRSSCFINAGTHYGVGHRQPVGTEKHTDKYAIPVGRVQTMRVDETG